MLIKGLAQNWRHGKTVVTNPMGQETQCGRHQGNSLIILSKPLYLEVKMKMVATEKLVTTSHCTGKLCMHVLKITVEPGRQSHTAMDVLTVWV